MCYPTINRGQRSENRSQRSERSVFCSLSSVLCLLSSVFCPLSLADEPFTYNSRNKRDPFVPLVTKDGRIIVAEPESSDDPTGMRLEGILYDTNGESIAALNGKIVKKGDRVGNYEVAQVGRNDIILLDSNNNSIILKLKGDIEQEGK